MTRGSMGAQASNPPLTSVADWGERQGQSRSASPKRRPKLFFRIKCQKVHLLLQNFAPDFTRHEIASPHKRTSKSALPHPSLPPQWVKIIPLYFNFLPILYLHLFLLSAPCPHSCPLLPSPPFPYEENLIANPNPFLSYNLELMLYCCSNWDIGVQRHLRPSLLLLVGTEAIPMYFPFPSISSFCSFTPFFSVLLRLLPPQSAPFLPI